MHEPLRTPPVWLVLLPIVGSYVGRWTARIAELEGTSPIGFTWPGTMELAGLLAGGTLALVLYWRAVRPNPSTPPA